MLGRRPGRKLTLGMGRVREECAVSERNGPCPSSRSLPMPGSPRAKRLPDRSDRPAPGRLSPGQHCHIQPDCEDEHEPSQVAVKPGSRAATTPCRSVSACLRGNMLSPVTQAASGLVVASDAGDRVRHPGPSATPSPTPGPGSHGSGQLRVDPWIAWITVERRATIARVCPVDPARRQGHSASAAPP